MGTYRGVDGWVRKDGETYRVPDPTDQDDTSAQPKPTQSQRESIRNTTSYLVSGGIVVISVLVCSGIGVSVAGVGGLIAGMGLGLCVPVAILIWFFTATRPK